MAVGGLAAGQLGPGQGVVERFTKILSRWLLPGRFAHLPGKNSAFCRLVWPGRAGESIGGRRSEGGGPDGGASAVPSGAARAATPAAIIAPMADTAGITLSADDRARRKPGEPARRPQLVLALECSRPGALSARHDLGGVVAVTIGRGRTRTAARSGDARAEELHLGVPDRWMSSRHARIDHSFGRWVLMDTESKNGSVVNGEPTNRAVLRDGDVIELGHTLFLFREGLASFADDARDLDVASLDNAIPGLVTLVPELARQLDKLSQVADSPIPVLLQGESGTGKEVVARAVHTISGRRGDFVAVNCGAIPANLVESELFGHKKGAFSGALEDRQGMVRAADGGTLFLDEIGDLPAASQSALLRVLQESEVTPVGATRPIPVDLRVVAATHRDLDTMVAHGGFRQDLYARLAGFRLALPRLCERIEDLGLLIGNLHDKVTGERGHPGFEPEAARKLFDYPWPLNIRELEQALATAAVLAGDETITVDHLPEHVRQGKSPAIAASATSSVTASRPLGREDLERRDELLGLLRKHRGNISAIARAMGKDRKQIQRWVKRYGLKAEDFRC